MNIETIKQNVIEFMKPEKSDKFISICNENYDGWGAGCNTCPLLEPCIPQIGDNMDSWIARMNKAAEYIKHTDDV